ncbi:MAG TPA: FAD-dependent oxidoreductase [Roseiflexaceae bacterium]|nr:FAD-dependent oxidoreductase [Roseiflexaceae bacterium]
MHTHARLVIVGAGIVGCSVAYHFARLGWRDVVVVDKGPLFENDGSTSHAPGGMFLTNSSKMMTEFAKYSRRLYGELELDGQELIFGVGGLEVAYTRERWHDLRRKQGWAKAYGLESHLISPSETRQLVPILDPGVIHGAFYTPADAVAKGVLLITALARAASADGAVTFLPETAVTDLEVTNGRVTAVLTERGRIAAEQVLLCTNIWGPLLAERMGVKIPLQAAQHLYTVTTPIPELAGAAREVEHPLMRHQDHAMYFRQHFDSYGVGSYRHEPLMVDARDVGRTAQRPFPPEHFARGWESAIELLPPLRGAGQTRQLNGMFAFTVDGFPVMGETSVRGLWVCIGLWLTHAGGAGRAIAEWMAEGLPPMDLREADITRFQKHQLARPYVAERCAQNYREVYDIIHPLQPIARPRNLRLSPVHQRLVEQGAFFFQSGGWEVAGWHEANAHLLELYEGRIPARDTWASRFWSPIQGAEHLHVRERVGLFNLSALAVLEVAGPGAAGFLNWLAANQVDRPVGKIVYTSLLNARGGIVADLTVVRRAPDRFWVITGGGVLPHDLAWIERHAPRDGSVMITDLSAAYGTIGLWGPRARAVLAALAEEDVSNAAFPYYTARPLTVDTAPVLALRVSYAGELGWELYTPTEYALRLWDALWEAGQPHGIIAAGSGAFDSLRLEKGYRLWGADIHTDYTPDEAGIGWAVRMDKGDFLGRAAVAAQRAAGIGRKLCCLTLDGPGVLLGKEPILAGGRPVGYVTSANYGYSVGRFIAYGYLPTEYAALGTKVEVEYFGEHLPATVSAEPLFDPKGARMKQ